MYIVYEAFTDNSAIVLDVCTLQRIELTEQNLINFASNHEVLGASVSNRKLNYLNAYNCISFASEEDVNDYIKENNLSYQNKRYINGYYFVFERKEYKIHVDYYVCTYAGEEVTYLCENGYSPYIQAAQAFDKRTAGEKAALMTKKSKTGKHWTTQRVIVNRTI